MKSIIIAAPNSGSGKTTITLGLMAYFRRRGLKVAPFKVGPDFIDPGYHGLVCGCPSINLDGWICSPAFVQETFSRHSAGADIAVIEGVMGLFDGISGVSDQGSTAHVARITGSPVVLVVDARSLARSAAALVKGFAEFDPRVRVAGVIFNNVAGESHARLLREALETLDTEIRSFGFIPRDARLHIPSRHLGLLTVDENPLSEEYLDHLAEVIKVHLDLALLWAAGAPSPTDPVLPFEVEKGQVMTFDKTVKCHDLTPIAVARDEAFCFVYEDNLRLLREAGAKLVQFSPLRDEQLPDGIGGIYLPGGYPEIYADALKHNRGMTEGIRNAVEAGMPVYAECGGFIYLTEGVVDSKNEMELFHEMLGIFPVRTRMLSRRKALGYREVELTRDSLLGPRGTIARGHEFHYSEMGEMPAQVEWVYRVRKSGTDLGTEGYAYKNCLASYVHLHFGSSPGMARSFVGSCRKFKENNPDGTKTDTVECGSGTKPVPKARKRRNKRDQTKK
jgi:cobyrinic acid a,c-diamide synthase